MAEARTDGFEAGALLGLLGRVGGHGSFFLFQLLLVRVLGPRDAGLLFPALALITLLSVVGRFGLDRVGLREVSADLRDGDAPGARKTAFWVVRTVLGVSAVLAALALALRALVGARLGLADHPWAVAFLLLSVPAWAVAFTNGELVRSARRVGLAATLQHILPFGLGILGILALGLTGRATLESVSALWFAAVAGSALLGVLVLSRILGTGRGDSPTAPAGAPGRPMAGTASGASMLQSGVPILLTSLVTMAMTQLDVLLLGFLVEAEQVSLYVAASRTAFIASLALVGVNAILAPLFVDHAGGDPKALEAVARRGARWAGAMAVAAAVVLLLGGPIFLGLFDGSFSGALPILAILLFGQVMNTLTGGVVLLMHMTGNERAAAAVLSVLLLVLIPAYLLAGREFGVTGVATVTALGMAVGNLTMVVVCRRATGALTLSDRFVPSVALFGTATMVALVLWASWPGEARWLWVPLSGLGVLAVWFGLLGPTDRAWFAGLAGFGAPRAADQAGPVAP